ncbi:glutamate 5-kinase [Alkalicoccus urumqiensis]|uniref:Glutamate 5-kinase n=1 Tax=Alkalicoccus urumqiensis TaxID=1548213 RepID=A0A2P6MKY8_ALKUR|nr:glutamate 5-kinase [Alkalicoccus urumqiensis]PRO66941.1 glutamate 5-kinase [Alkalicoccus urumqiensis]
MKQRIVIKIGSSSLTEADGTLSPLKLAKFCHAFQEAVKSGHELIVVSSGSVAAGFREIGYHSRPETIQGKQAAAAVGQSLLMQHYRFSLQQYGVTAAQLLLTRHDFQNGEHYQNVTAVLEELLRRGILPIINENDSTAVDELTFGDNDMLSALIAGAVHADTLILMTDVDGIYSANPAVDPEAVKYETLSHLPPSLFKNADGSTSGLGTGGMRSKLRAAQAAQEMGARVFVGTYNEKEPITAVAEGSGRSGTYIHPQRSGQMKTQKQWIAYHAAPKGRVLVDDGAEEALLKHGRSLLLVGVSQMDGHFQESDVVDVYNQDGVLIGKGRAAEAASRLREKAGISPSPLVIHRDHWVRLADSQARKEHTEHE